MKIHPTAIVSPEAILGEDVEIGPYAIVETGVEIGNRCILQARSVLIGRTILGDDNLVGYGAIIGAEPQDFAYQPGTSSEVRIGNRNKIREYVTIHRGTGEGTTTRVGDDNFLMNGVHLGHNCVVGNHTVLANNVLLGGYVEIEDGAVVGGGNVFHQHMRVGRNVMVRGGARFSKDIPPYTVANYTNTLTGLNSIGLKRAGLPSETRLELKRAFKLLYLDGLNVSQALQVAEQQQWGPEALRFFEFIRIAAKRGICRYSGGKDPGDINVD
jgi:UDP-N-acetylglucosamine acyltransferase